jgi:hypothetical protein
MPVRNDPFQPITKAGALPAATAPIAWWSRIVVIFGALLMAVGAALALWLPPLPNLP